MSLVLSPIHNSTLPIELRGFLPEATLGKSTNELAKTPVFLGRSTTELGDLFALSGKTHEARIIFEGDFSNVHWIGAGMQQGEIVINGNSGRHLGSQMSGGSIRVDGNSSDFLGCEMTGGTIRMCGDTGSRVGASYPGSRRGMNRGTIIINGNAGDQLGSRMRRGLIVVGGDCGELCGHHMLAGTVFTFGTCAGLAGTSMKRGTLALLGSQNEALPVTFVEGSRLESITTRLLARQLKSLGVEHSHLLLEKKLRIFHGDMLEGGRGEIWI